MHFGVYYGLFGQFWLVNAYLGEKMSYSYDSFIPYALLNILYRFVSRVMHISTS